MMISIPSYSCLDNNVPKSGFLKRVIDQLVMLMAFIVVYL